MDEVAPGLGVGARTLRPKLNTLPLPPFVPGEIVVGYDRADAAVGRSPTQTRQDVRDRLSALLDRAAVESRPLLPSLRPGRARGTGQKHLQDRLARRSRFGLDRVDVFSVPVDADVIELAGKLDRLPGVAYARPNFTFDLLFTPNDPFYSSADSWGQGYDDLYGPKLLDCEQAWDITQGAGVLVAVVDSGVDHQHPDLAASMWINTAEDANTNGTYEPWSSAEQREGVFGDHDGVDDDGNGYVDDVVGYDFSGNGDAPDPDPRDTFGHGSHVAGIIAATGDNARGTIGIAPSARIMALKISVDGSGGVSATAATEAVIYAAENGAQISNHSWGGFGDETLVPALVDAFNLAADAGMVSVAAAGNSNADVALIIPAKFDSTIAVAATDHNDLKAGFSNFGLGIDVSAPGGGESLPEEINRPASSVLSLAGANTVLKSLEGGVLVVGSEYLRLGGTSMASPHVAGVAALLRAAFPADSPDEIRARLKVGADFIDQINPDFAGRLGAGRVNALGSLTVTPQPLLELLAVVPSGLVAPGGTFEIAVTVSNSWRPAEQVSLTLSSPSPQVFVFPTPALLGDMAVGQQLDNNNGPFQVALSPSLTFGEVIPFELALEHAGGRSMATFTIATQLFQDTIFSTGLPSSGVSSISISLEDVDVDAFPEVLFTRIFRTPSYYRNARHGTFEILPLPLDVISVLGMAVFDIDNDGLRDLSTPGSLAGQRVTKVFFRGLGGHQFESAVPTGDLQNTATSRILPLDADLDGLLDLMIFGAFRVRLFRNLGNVEFTEVTDQALPELEYGGQGFNDAILTDYDNDGFADVIATGGGGRGLLILRNQGDGTFEDATPYAALPVADAQDLAVGDFNNDGWMDIFAGDKPGDGPANYIFQNNGDGTFSDVTEDAGAVYEIDPDNRPSAFNGSECFDFDNDGWLDIFVQVGDNHASPLARLYQSTGTGSFTDETATHITLPDGARFTAAYDDFDNDGDVDIYLSDSLFGTAGFYKNYTTAVGDPNHWVRIRLKGTESNDNAFGARVTVRAGPLEQIRDVSNANIASQPLHFGLGKQEAIDEVMIRWPNGIIQRHRDQPVDTTLFFVEGDFRRGDLDGDGDIDLSDFTGFAGCFMSEDAECLARFDFDGQPPVGLNDFLTFIAAFSDSASLLVNAGPSHTIYVNRQAQLLQPVVNGGRAPYSYQWDPAEGLSAPNSPTPVADPLVDTVYTLTVTDAENRSASDSLLVRVLPMAVTLGDDIAIFGDQKTAMPVPQIFGGIAPYSYAWSPPTGLDAVDVPAPTASPNVTTDYTLTVIDSADPPHVAQQSLRIFVDGIYELEDMGDGVRGITLVGSEDNGDFGISVAAADVNGDQVPDLIIGAPSNDFGEDDRGAAYVVFGGAAAVGAGTILTEDLDGTLGFEIRGLADNDFLGATVAGIGDVNDDTFGDFAVTAAGADGGGDLAGAVYVILGMPNIGQNGVVDLATLDGTTGFVIHGLNAEDDLGNAIAAVGDVNDDGVDDFAVGAVDADPAGVVVGAAYVIFGSASIGAGGAFDLATLDGSNGIVFVGTNQNDRVGIDLGALGDWNGDQIDDLLISADSIDRPNPDPKAEGEFIGGAGGAYVLFGSTEFTAPGFLDAASLDGSNGFAIWGANQNEFMGFSASGAGDFNGDSSPDLVLGAPYADVGANNAGAAFVLFGGSGVGSAGVVDMLALTASDGFRLQGTALGHVAGYDVAVAGDTNGDNAGDIIVGLPGDDRSVFVQGTGSAYVVFGGMGTGATGLATFDEFIGPTGFIAQGTRVVDFAGVSVAGAGDIDGDDYDDVMISAPNAMHEPSGTRPGLVYVIFGKPPASAAK